MSTELKPLTWQQLKEIVNTLNEDQLAEPVRWWGDERGGMVYTADTLAEDYVDMGYGLEPKSGYAEDPDFDIEDADLVISKGTPILSVD